jgi:hypothetical protein
MKAGAKLQTEVERDCGAAVSAFFPALTFVRSASISVLGIPLS